MSVVVVVVVVIGVNFPHVYFSEIIGPINLAVNILEGKTIKFIKMSQFTFKRYHFGKSENGMECLKNILLQNH